MVSLKRTHDEDDDTVVAINPAGLVSRKFAKTYKLACEFVAADAEATQVQAAPVTPTASAAPAPANVPAPVPPPVPASDPATVSAPAPASNLTPAPVTMTENMSEDENEGSSMVSPDRLALRVSLSSRWSWEYIAAGLSYAKGQGQRAGMIPILREEILLWDRVKLTNMNRHPNTNPAPRKISPRKTGGGISRSKKWQNESSLRERMLHGSRWRSVRKGRKNRSRKRRRIGKPRQGRWWRRKSWNRLGQSISCGKTTTKRRKKIVKTR